MANDEPDVTDVQAMARVLTHAVSVVNRLTEESDRLLELLKQAEAQQHRREEHLARTEQAAQDALKTAQTSAAEIETRQRALAATVVALPERLLHGIKDKAGEVHRASTDIMNTSKEAAAAMQAERQQLRRWAASNLGVRAAAWFGVGLLPTLMLLLALMIFYDVKLVGGRNMIGIELHDPPPRPDRPTFGQPRIAPQR